LVALLLALSGISCSFVQGQLTELPKDATLVARFADQRGDFDKLLRMSNEDSKLLRIAADFTWVAGEKKTGEIGKDRPLGFSPERWEEYKAVFSKLGLRGGLVRSEDGTMIMLIAHAQGIVPAGLEKGYVFTTVPLNCDAESLDIPGALRERKFACKELGGNWYLYMSR